MLKPYRHILIAALLLAAGAALAQDAGIGIGIPQVAIRGGGGPPAPPSGQFLLLVGGGNILLVGGGNLQCVGSC